MSYWWSLVATERGNVLLGPYSSDVQASIESKKIGYSFKLFELPTRDDSRASRMIKARTHSLENIRR